MSLSDEQAHSISLCEHLGIPWRYEYGVREEWFGWNGESLNVAAQPSPDGGNLIHEIAHWLVAPAERRNRPDFGLGLPGYSGTPFTKSDGCAYPEDEESLASMLGILIERAVGLPWGDTWMLHEWHVAPNTFRTYRWLVRRGLVKDGVPICLMDATSARKSR